MTKQFLNYLDLNTGKELKFREVPSPSFNDFEMTYYKVYLKILWYIMKLLILLS
jgi:hypothetical protein